MSLKCLLSPNTDSSSSDTTCSTKSGALKPRQSDDAVTEHKVIDQATQIRREKTERKRQWRQTRTEEQRKHMRERDAERKRAERKQMSPEQRLIERKKDARRKALKRLREKGERRSTSAMSLSRILNS